MNFKVGLWAAVVLMSLGWVSPAAAQPATNLLPIRGFVVDARVVFPRAKANPIVAEALGVTTPNMPTKGRGFAIGGQWLALRTRHFTVGIGGEYLVSKATRTLTDDTTGEPVSPTVIREFRTFSPAVSLNFGKRLGWSYISGGVGSTKYTLEKQALSQPGDIIVPAETPTAEKAPSPLTINYGGGARWFLTPHFGIQMDLRFYKIAAQEGGQTRIPLPRSSLTVLSAGVSIR